MKSFVQTVGHWIFQTLARTEALLFDRFLLEPSVPTDPTISHLNWPSHLSALANKPHMKILEIGSREVVNSSFRSRFAAADYVGFDYHPGPNVDVTGDVHKLSSYFPPQHFDLVFSEASFEHFAMPWVVAEEIAKVVKVGGHVFVETHFCFGAHERPWNFFNFSDMGLRALFSRALGFECVSAGMSNPIAARFSAFADKYLRYHAMKGMYCHSQYLGKKVREINGFSWAKAEIRDVVGETVYPPPSV